MRPLRADEVELRIGQIYKTGVSYLLYKTARTDMNILDEVFGEMEWQKDNKEIKGNVYCGIGVKYAELDEWIWKWACGTESNTEAEKGEDSDSFKRAGFLWGIGRELYTAPLIFFKVATVQDGNRYKLANPNELKGLYVKELETEDLDTKRIITKLVINQKYGGKDMEVYRWTYGR